MDRHSKIKLTDIRIDGGTQSRARLNERHLQHLTDILDDSGRLEPVEVVYDGVEYWLWDGFHRMEVYRRAKMPRIPAHITQGTQRDAILKSCGANGQHGLPRCNADKRRAVVRLLIDDEWGAWPDSQLARTAGVSREYVVRLRAELIAKGELSCDRSQDKQVIRGGTTYTMDTTNIGKTEPDPLPMPVVDPPKPADPPKHWMETLIPGKRYPVDRKRGVVINEPFDSDQECRAAYPGLRPETKAYLLMYKTFFTMYRFVAPEQPIPAPEGQAIHAADVDDSTSPDEPTAPALTIQPEKWYPVKHTEKVIYCDPFDRQADGAADPRYEGHAIQHGKIILAGIDSRTVYASYQIVKPKEQPRHDPRAVSNAGEWTPGEKAYMNRSQAAVNHAHPGKMPYVAPVLHASFIPSAAQVAAMQEALSILEMLRDEFPDGFFRQQMSEATVCVKQSISTAQTAKPNTLTH